MSPRVDPAPRLREVQRWMRWALTDPRGVAAALADPRPEHAVPAGRYRAPVLGGENWIEAPADRVARLDVYAEGYFIRIADALAEDFPALRRAVGPANFLKLCADYLKHRPSRSWTLGEAGREFPEFIAAHPIAADARWLTDLARLEWAAVLAFHSSDEPALRADELQSVPEDRWAAARFGLDPSVQLLECGWPVQELWEAREGEAFQDAVNALKSEPTPLVVYRTGGGAAVRRLDPPAFALLSAMAGGASLGELCARADGQFAAAEPGSAEARLMAWFGAWMQAGWIGRIDWEDAAPPANFGAGTERTLSDQEQACATE